MASDLGLRKAAVVLATVGQPFVALGIERWRESNHPYRGWVAYLLWPQRLGDVAGSR